jgi:hypothetical protein
MQGSVLLSFRSSIAISSIYIHLCPSISYIHSSNMATTAISVGGPPSRKRISSFNLPSDHVVTEPERRACTNCNRLRSLYWFTNLRAKGKDKLSLRCFACRGKIAQIQECSELDRQQAVVRCTHPDQTTTNIEAAIHCQNPSIRNTCSPSENSAT